MDRNYVEQQFHQYFPGHEEVELFRAPGRTEWIGNHCDHQHGRVIASTIQLSIYGAVAPNDSNVIHVISDGFEEFTVDLDHTTAGEAPKGSSASLVCGILDQMQRDGFLTYGLDIFVITEIPVGSGLSSSAAFELLIATIANFYFCDEAYSPLDLAQISQKAENLYFGKPCGLMDQLTIAVGGLVAMDFEDPEEPIVERLPVCWEKSPYHMVMVHTGSSHENLTEDYASIPKDMKTVASCLGKQVLRDVDILEFYNNREDLKQILGERPITRSEHFFEENQRVIAQKMNLLRENWSGFLTLELTSGNSSWKKLHNVVALGKRDINLGMSILCSEQFLKGIGACRVHGGGFAGSMQAFVPKEKTAEYILFMEQFLEQGCCQILTVTSRGATRWYE